MYINLVPIVICFYTIDCHEVNMTEYSILWFNPKCNKHFVIVTVLSPYCVQYVCLVGVTAVSSAKLSFTAIVSGKKKKVFILYRRHIATLNPIIPTLKRHVFISKYIGSKNISGIDKNRRK